MADTMNRILRKSTRSCFGSCEARFTQRCYEPKANYHLDTSKRRLEYKS